MRRQTEEPEGTTKGENWKKESKECERRGNVDQKKRKEVKVWGGQGVVERWEAEECDQKAK